ncbi:ankyrin repeat-containing domain protein [Fusarium flagelliforme]|uniref:Uncharacterized protein n=1 Tax=Fusarium flagelliforme TaxID=2675880 RepID=A0A395MUU9_9HYPO|nr:ankyrin repeat-containing domain protein [Fusarium flagelliforme]KAH7185900.1 ankyrin repeat-containing domain protein [Fusarium flagelliforme]RFN51213.1 hypothetical protein FIE12Z_4531 [Fusarium flagelliforme]
MTLRKLPNEMPCLIGAYCQTGQLGSLSLVSRHFHALYNPCLYKHNILYDKPNKACVFWAAKKGSLDTLKLAFRYGADLNSTGAPSEGFIRTSAYSALDPQTYAAPLHLAALYNHEHIVKWLLEKGTRLDVPSRNLCGCKDLRNVRRLPPDWVFTPWYPVHYAIFHGGPINESILNLLLKHGAMYATEDLSPIADAIQEPREEAIDIILQQDDFDPNYRDSMGATALHHLVPRREVSKTCAIIKKLIDRGVPIDAKANGGATIFTIMVHCAHFPIAIELLNAGADASEEVWYERSTITSIILGNGIDEAKKQGRDQLAKLLTQEQRELIRLAIKRGADVNGLFTDRFRPVYCALIFLKDPKCLKIMLDAGARTEDAVIDRHSNAKGLLSAFFDERDGYLWHRDDRTKPGNETDLEPYKASLKLLLKRGARIDAPSQHQISALDEICGRAAKGKENTYELEFLVKYATNQNASVGYVEELMKRNKGRGEIQALLGQLYTKLLNITGDDEIEDDDEEDSDDEPYSTPAFLPRCC